MEKIFTDEFLEEIGFERQTEYNYENFAGETIYRYVRSPYGRAIDKRTNGMTVLEWNNEGPSCTYFGDPLEDSVYLSIGKDGDTRKVFNGYVFTKEDVEFLLSRTW